MPENPDNNRSPLEEIPATEIPPITTEMKQAIITILGDWLFTNLEDPDLNILVAYHVEKGKPAFRFGIFNFANYQGEPTWENAWQYILEELPRRLDQIRGSAMM